MKYKNIMVPLDFSKCALNALKYAIQFATEKESKLIVLHAYHVPVPAAESGVYMNTNIITDFEKDATEKFNEIRKSLPGLQSVKVEFKTKALFAFDAILQEIDQSDVDLIIMGTHGASNTFDELIGSNTLHVIKRSKVPVLAIPANYENFQIDHILFAFDFRELGAKQSLDPLIQFALDFGAMIHVLHITDKLDRLHQGAIEEAKILESYLRKVPHQYEMLEDEHVEDGIMGYLDNNQMDVICVMPRKHSLLERLFQSSITKQLAHHSNIPLLAFHTEA